MSLKRIVLEYEAKLYAEGAGLFSFLPKKHGKLEYKQYGSGEVALKIKLRRLQLPVSEAEVSVLLNDACIAKVAVQDGTGRLRLTTDDGDTVPEINRDDRVAVVCDGETLCSGVFVRD